MKKRKLDNFYQWREEMKKAGKIPSVYPPFKKNGDLAELLGVVLGDGHIGKFPRTEALRIAANANHKGFINRYAMLVEKIFGKRPHISKRTSTNCTNITIYQKNISKRLEIPSGARKNRQIALPRWISKNRNYTIRYLRGLYEAEGSYCIHEPTSTYKFFFANVNHSMLNNVYNLTLRLGFHPNMSGHRIQISRRSEVENIRKLLQFRQY
ncbi:MAG: hypothetical protein A3I09_00750 [Deltaproteobacteria bacterium RIFCSPLOWO2_02_FULL_47_10]|nr:MAG: hypothetical protein A3I09_00750 [Deltaproteobacteria bacterium RIFCSPLOWO2_02_FULL_47_10]